MPIVGAVMLRIAMVTCVLAAALPAAGFAARRADTPAAAGPVAKVVSCDVTSSARSATFYGRMDTQPGASKMQIRFGLLERLGKDGGFDRLDVGALRQWHTSQAGGEGFGLKATGDHPPRRGGPQGR